MEEAGLGQSSWLNNLNCLKIIAIIRQCDQMARIFFIIWLLTTVQICQKLINFSQTRNIPSKVCLRILKVCPRGKIWPNLVTLSHVQLSVKMIRASTYLFLVDMSPIWMIFKRIEKTKSRFHCSNESSSACCLKMLDMIFVSD